MARAFAGDFYHSKEWKKTREYVLMRDNYLCQYCGKPAAEVHHKIHLSENNIYDREINLNPDNLISLCKSCHFEQHYGDKGDGHRHKATPTDMPEYYFDENGMIVEKK